MRHAVIRAHRKPAMADPALDLRVPCAEQLRQFVDTEAFGYAAFDLHGEELVAHGQLRAADLLRDFVRGRGSRHLAYGLDLRRLPALRRVEPQPEHSCAVLEDVARPARAAHQLVNLHPRQPLVLRLVGAAQLRIHLRVPELLLPGARIRLQPAAAAITVLRGRLSWTGAAGHAAAPFAFSVATRL